MNERTKGTVPCDVASASSIQALANGNLPTSRFHRWEWTGLYECNPNRLAGGRLCEANALHVCHCVRGMDHPSSWRQSSVLSAHNALPILGCSSIYGNAPAERNLEP